MFVTLSRLILVMIFYCLIIAITFHCGMTIDVLALSSSPSPSSSSHPKSAHQRDKNLEKLKQVVNVIQNPELYSTSWANFVELIEDPEHNDDSSVRRRHRDGDGDSDGKQDRWFLRPIASCDVTKGQIIALHPVQDISFQRRKKLNRKQRQKRRRELLHDDLKISIEVNLLEEEKYPYPCIRQGWIDDDDDDDDDDNSNSNIEKETRNVFIHSDDKIHPGWYGNLIPTAAAAAAAAAANRHQSHNNTLAAGNCILVPLPGAAPFCVLVATRDIAQGDIIEKKEEEKHHSDIDNADNDNDREAENNRHVLYYVQSIAKEYANEIGELVSFLDMACALSSSLPSSPSSSLIFHSINESYPKLEKIHSSPDIYSIQDFLSESECERIIKKVSSNNGINMRPCLIKNEATGIVEPDLTRTSLNANIARREVPTIIQKIINLMNNDNDSGNDKNTTNSCGTSMINEEQIEILQVLRYRNGQEFKSHTDGFNGPTTACGFYQSGRIATIFCYLNNVTDSGGGKTTFPLLTGDGRSSSLDITPKRGLAVVHFPTSLDLKEDQRTEHIGNPVTDMEEKWILTVWVWKNRRADMRYSEDALPFLSDDII